MLKEDWLENYEHLLFLHIIFIFNTRKIGKDSCIIVSRNVPYQISYLLCIF